MIVLDTHVWVWWAMDIARLSQTQVEAITLNEDDVIGVSAISCWEVAKLNQYGRLRLPIGVSQWLSEALQYPGVSLPNLTPEIAVSSTQLPVEFHRDPADQIIVATAMATAMINGCALVTRDEKLVDYAHVQTIS